MKKLVPLALCFLVLLAAPVIVSPILAAQEATSADEAGKAFQRPSYAPLLRGQNATSAADPSKDLGQKAAESSIPAEFTDRAVLASANWTDVAFVHAIASGWDRYTGTQPFENKEVSGGAREVLYAKEIQISGGIFSATVRRFNSDGVFEFVFVGKDDATFSRDFREKFMSSALTKWGTPFKDVDTSLTEKEGSTDSHDVEWVIGNTQIKFTFSGMDMYGRRTSTLCALVITRNGKYPPLKDLIALKCEGQSRLFGFEDPTVVTPDLPFVVVVNLNDNSLLRRDKSILGKITQASEDYFVAEWQDEDTKTAPAPVPKTNELIIDRKLGTYEWKTTLLANKSQGKVSSGNCEKTNLQMDEKF